MTKDFSSRIASGNRLLERLSPALYKRIQRHLKPVKLETDQVLHKARTQISYVYFPIWGVTSFLTLMANGDAIEVGTVGNEGMVGVGGLLGTLASPYQVIVQFPGEALRVELKPIEKEVQQDASFHRLLIT